MRGPGNAGAGDLAGKPRAVLSSEVSACSACAGDYEDPDRTAWPTEEEKADAAEEPASEFPDGDPKERN
jgi:hypothetical protein